MSERTPSVRIQTIEFFHENFENRVKAENFALQAIYQYVVRDRKDQRSILVPIAIEQTLRVNNSEESLAVRLALKDDDFHTTNLMSAVVTDGIIRMDRQLRVGGDITTIHKEGYVLDELPDDPFSPQRIGTYIDMHAADRVLA